MKLVSFIRSAYGGFSTAASFFQSPLLLLVRAYWGWQFFQAGWMKLSDLEKTTGFFTQMGFAMPGVNAFMAGAVEGVGGLMLVAGLASRAAAFALGFTMVIAYLTVSKAALLGALSAPTAFVQADQFPYLFASVLVFAFGPGLLSVDALLGRIWGKKEPKQDAGMFAQ